MLSRLSAVSKSSCCQKRRRRLSLLAALRRTRHYAALARCSATSVTASKKTLTAATSPNWSAEPTEGAAVPFGPNTGDDADGLIATPEWRRLEELCTSGLRLVRAALEHEWGHVDGAVYSRAFESRADPSNLKFYLVSNLDLVDESAVNATSPFARDALYLTERGMSDSDVDTTTYLLQNEVVDIPSRSCALFPLVGGENEILGLLLLSVPQWKQASLVSSDKMGGIVKQTRTMLLSAMEQYQSVIDAQSAAHLQKQFTKAMLEEGKGAAKSVRSYAKMLSFRPATGTVEQDMIHGIEHQGERMSDIVRRLETALNADSKQLPVFSPFAPASTSALPVTPPPSYMDN